MKAWMIMVLSILCMAALTNSTLVVTVSKQTLSLFFEVLIPSLFFMLVLLKTMEQTGMLVWLGNRMHSLTKYVLKSQQQEMPYVLSGFLLGFAGNASLIASARRDGVISEVSARRLLFHIHAPTITFCVVTCGVLLGDSTLGVMIYLVQVLYCLVGFRCSSQMVKDDSYEKRTSFAAQKNRPLLTSLTRALAFSGLALYQMAGYILLASVVLSFAVAWLPKAWYLPLQSIFEFASSAVRVSQLSIPLPHRIAILSAIFGFGGFAGHLQVFTFLDGFALRYDSYFALRVLQSLVCSITVFVLAVLWL